MHLIFLSYQIFWLPSLSTSPPNSFLHWSQCLSLILQGIIIEIRKCSHLVQSHAASYPPTCFYTHCADFTRTLGVINIQPHSGKSFLIRPAKTLNSASVWIHAFLQQSHIPMNVGEEIFQVENRIADQLSWAVICDVATTVDMKIRCNRWRVVFFNQ